MIAVLAGTTANTVIAWDKTQDDRIDAAIFKTIDLGVRLYNNNDQYGCYRLYQGQAFALLASTTHHPKLAAVIQAGLDRSENEPRWEGRATILRETLDQVRSALKSQPSSLWDRLGGEPAVKAVVHDFVALAASDPKVDFTRGGRYPIDAAGVANLEKLLVELVSATTGGPLKYTGRDMKSSHKGMAITEAEFGAIAGDLIAVLKKYNVPQKEQDELIKIIASTKNDIVEATTPTTLWGRLGGEPAVKAVIHDFVALAATDPKVDFTRGGRYQIDDAGVANLEKLLVELVSATTGGPLKYTGRDMKSSHKGMRISDAEFNALASDLIKVLNKYKVPKKEQDELVKIIASTREDIVENAPPPPPAAPVPLTPPAPNPSASRPAAAAPMTNKSLYERLGGAAALQAVVDDFVARAATDPKVNFTRKGTATEWQATPENVAHLKKALVQLLTVTTGGPGKYEGRDMKSSHKGMGITNDEFGAIAADLKATLDKFKVPSKEQEELFKIVGSTASDIIEKP
jgi:hemoglobin